MKINIKLDENCRETEITITANKLTDEVSEIMQRLSDTSNESLLGYDENSVVFIDQTDIVRVYATAKKVYAVTDKKEYTLRNRLYDMEEKLNKKIFIRISNSEIINIKKVKKFDLSFVGTICISLSDGTISYASRRYVTKIKKFLGI